LTLGYETRKKNQSLNAEEQPRANFAKKKKKTKTLKEEPFVMAQ